MEKKIIHPLYDSSEFYYDVGLLKLKEELVYNQRIAAVCLPDSPSNTIDTYQGHAATLTGWGATELGGPASSKLRQTRLTIFSQQFCNQSRITELNGRNVTSGKLSGTS